MELRTAASPRDVVSYDTQRLRSEFLVDNLFSPDFRLVYSHFDRIIIGGIAPLEPKALASADALRTDYFCDNRELGVLNIGGAGTITVDGKRYEVNYREGMYIGKGTKEIVFDSLDKTQPAKFYLNSCPAHMTYPTVLIKPDGIPEDGVIIVKPENKLAIGSIRTSNDRTICKYIVPGQVQSCQLCMGITTLNEGSVWNSMPCHTHDRRMEVYMYFNLSEDDFVMHYMGEPQETRHIILRNEQAVISPSWSIHAGSGTSAYAFVWGMCGENKVFDDMDHVAMRDLL